MRIPERIRKKLSAWSKRYMASRQPDFIIRPRGEDQTQRWHVLPKNPFFNIYLHKWLQGDSDREMHCHPWLNLSILIDGNYIEHMLDKNGREVERVRNQGFMYFRRAKTRHKVQLFEGKKIVEVDAQSKASWIDKPMKVKRFVHVMLPCTTIFITGPRIRNWGFYCPKGFVPWQTYCDNRDKGVIGKGCEG